jgi:hypothetical protein
MKSIVYDIGLSILSRRLDMYLHLCGEI